MKKFKKGDIVYHHIIFSSPILKDSKIYSKGKVIDSGEANTIVEWGDGKCEINSTQFLDLCKPKTTNHPHTKLFK